MPNHLNISKDLNHNYFWDVEISTLHPEKSKRLIIERVFSLGTLNEIKKILNYYGEEQVITTLKNLNYLDPKTLNFVAKLFNIPLNEFKCYTRKSSSPQHWNS